MEYFDFEEASYASNNVQDDVASDCQEVDEAEAVENYESLFYDKNFQLHADSGLTADHVDDLHDQGPDPQPRADTPVVPEPAPGSQYPMFRSPLPCDFCRQMGFDCFLIQRGVLNNGCTCCVSLWRECSFTHAKAPGKYLHTLHPVGEDDVTSTGGLTGRRALKSVGSSKFDHLESRGRKSGARFSRDAVRILKNWLSEHYQHPYPNEAEKDALKERTGLRRSQIANWLANARRRGKVLPSARSSSPTPGAIDIPGSTHTSSTSSTTSTSSSSTLEYALMTPLERWKHSPPEHEAASIGNIIRAMANASPPPPSPSHAQHQHQQQNHYAPPTVSGHGRSLSRKTGSSNDSSSLFQAPSVSSYDTENKSSISDYSFASAFSHRSSQHSFNSADRKERRRRRKQMPPVPAFERQTVRRARIFQCTFCTDSFPAKYDWQRHEKSVHLALEKWTCAPRGGVITTIDGKKACAFCRAPNPTEDHLETHNYLACQEKTVQERTFYRKDHLNQHLRLMHDVKYDSSMDQWRSTTNEIKSRCGLCDTNFTTWKDRVDHIAQHFKNGADMSQWEGDWGFEPYVQRLVENGIAPYLIASERASSSQDRAPRTSHSKKVASSFAGSQPLSLPVPADETSFTRLESELKAFIGGQLFDGETPTDKRIQDQARMIVYGCDDPWNQTCADNVVWLSVLKRDCGMEDLPGLDNITLEDLGMQPPFAGRMQHPPLETNNLVAGNVRDSWFSNASLGSAAVSASGLQSPAFISSNGFHSAAHSMQGSLAGSFSGSIGVSSAGPSSIIPGLSSGWSSNFSVGEQSASDWAGSAAFVDPMAQSNFDLELLQQLNDSESQGMDIDASIFDMEGLTSQDEIMPELASAAAKNPQSLDPVTTAVMATSGTQPISIPTTTAAGNSADMHSYLFSSQPGYN